MRTYIKNTTTTDFYLQIDALNAQSRILKELGLDSLSCAAKHKARELKQASMLKL
ncbi:MAG: hypothetical protein ACK5MJ_04120 [Alphaproteobacteria bacterium]